MKMYDMKYKSMPEGKATMIAEPSEYPHNLKIYLEDAQLKAMGIKELPEVGAEMLMHAKVYVCSKTEHEGEAGENYCMTIQITEMVLDAPKKSASSAIYGDDD